MVRIALCGVVVSLLSLSAVDPAYSQARNFEGGDSSKGFSQNAFADSQNPWRQSSFSADDEAKIKGAGIMDPAAASRWLKALGVDYSQGVTDTEVATLKNCIAVSQQTPFTPDDLQSVVAAQKEPLNEFEAYLASALVHRGTAVEVAISQAREKSAERDKAAKQQADKSEFGDQLLGECGGAPEKVQLALAFNDPYATKGKCYEIWINSRYGSLQWISSQSLMIHETLPYGPAQTYSTIISDPNGHLALGKTAIVIGGEPVSYETAIGAQEVAPSFTVLKYLN